MALKNESAKSEGDGWMGYQIIEQKPGIKREAQCQNPNTLTFISGLLNWNVAILTRLIYRTFLQSDSEVP
ncbi:hypothetical protein CY34DRAFT_799080 [Suillus luteus UH-Slu-Lm8-n1]|uniref:Uncharacterized protein n=1 Tax=Suillus luteus UH-Slu-Lm8-n1 TaxID=930992 RepID=A0A0D0BCS1_9AGAM|nr:hypothetical protein CY34DRAFT_799080 [Suillus luteus UH-Slu-Lm8-n1]